MTAEPINCEKCHVGTMIEGRPAAYTEAARTAGGFLVFLGLLALVGSAVSCLDDLTGRNIGEPSPFILSVGLLTAGAILRSRRLVWRCAHCGYYYSRARLDEGP